jgi:hypothetical protein
VTVWEWLRRTSVRAQHTSRPDETMITHSNLESHRSNDWAGCNRPRLDDESGAALTSALSPLGGVLLRVLSSCSDAALDKPSSAPNGAASMSRGPPVAKSNVVVPVYRG